MQNADEVTVKGDFDDAEFTYAGVTSRFYREDDRFIVRTDGPDGELHDYEIAYTFGIEPLQQYLIEFPGGRLQALNICWDTRPEDQGGQRWFHLYPDEAVDHEDVLHWTGQLQNWNYMCSECHSTDVRKNYDLAADRYDTRWAEIDVSCEACHGPGSRHVTWAREREEGGETRIAGMGLAVSLTDDDKGTWVFDEGARNAHRVPARSSRTEIETCARCHARRTQLTDDYVYGRPFSDTHRVSLLLDPLYHVDGQILDEVYVYGSFLQSRMYAHGVTCGDCHDPHTASPRLEANRTCSPCHLPRVFDTPEHHFHKPDSTGASCVECHMPAREYMVVDPRRDHSIRIPRPDLSVKLGTPNACNACHADKTVEWAAEATAQWYGHDDEPHWAETIHAGRTWQPGAAAGLVAVVDDPEIPAIVRATALGMMRNYPSPGTARAVRAGADDADPLVRRVAADMLSVLEPATLKDLGFPLLDDPVRSVRIEAAQALASLPREDLSATQRVAFDRGLAEYAEAQVFNQDRPENRMNLAWLQLQDGNVEEAERWLRSAVERMPSFAPAAINLSDLYRLTGREAEAEAILRETLGHSPDDPDLHHSLGLALVRQKRHEEALEALERASRLAPDEPGYAYVLGVALNSLGRGSRALEVLKPAHERFPAHPDLLFMLAAISRDNGDVEAARSYAKQLREVAPGHPGAEGVLRELGR